MGSSMNDLALRVDFSYEYVIIVGTFEDITEAQTTSSKLKAATVSPSEDEEGNATNILTILPVPEYVPTGSEVESPKSEDGETL